MTQHIKNLPSETLMDVCLKRLKAWPESWGKYVVADLAGLDKALWFGDSKPGRVVTGGWSGVGTVEAWLSVLPVDQRDAIVHRDCWLKHSRYTLLNMLVDSMPEWGEDCGEFAVWNDGVDPAHQGKPGAVLFCDSKPSDPMRDSLDKQTDAVWTFPTNDKPVDCYTAVVTRSQWLEGALKRQDAPIERVPESSAYQCEYYECPVDHPMNPRQGGVPYIANCEDIILALGMSFDEGCQFKAQWRRARGLQGFQKAESTPLRDAQKAVHYAKRVLAAEERKGA